MSLRVSASDINSMQMTLNCICPCDQATQHKNSTVRDWYLSNQLRSATSIDSVVVAGVALPVATILKLLGAILDPRTHVRHLLTESVAQTV